MNEFFHEIGRLLEGLWYEFSNQQRVRLVPLWNRANKWARMAIAFSVICPLLMATEGFIGPWKAAIVEGSITAVAMTLLVVFFLVLAYPLRILGIAVFPSGQGMLARLAGAGRTVLAGVAKMYFVGLLVGASFVIMPISNDRVLGSAFVLSMILVVGLRLSRARILATIPATVAIISVVMLFLGGWDATWKKAGDAIDRRAEAAAKAQTTASVTPIAQTAIVSPGAYELKCGATGIATVLPPGTREAVFLVRQCDKDTARVEIPNPDSYFKLYHWDASLPTRDTYVIEMAWDEDHAYREHSSNGERLKPYEWKSATGGTRAHADNPPSVNIPGYFRFKKPQQEILIRVSLR